MIDQVEIHRLAQSENVEEQRRVVDELRVNFAILNDKEQAWDDLHRLITQDKNDHVRISAIIALVSCYPHLPGEYKKQAWDDLYMLVQDKNENIRLFADIALGSCYSHLPRGYKKQAWDDLYRLTQNKKGSVLSGASKTLCSCYPHLPEDYKKQAWDDLYRLTQNKNDSVRSGAGEALGSCYPHLPEENKKQAWDDLHRLSQDKNDSVRSGASKALGSCYSHLPEEYKKQAWYDLHRLSQDKNDSVRKGAGEALGSCYPHLPEEYKKQAWYDLHRLTQDKKGYVRVSAYSAVGSCYSHLPEENKKQAWDDLYRPTQNNDLMWGVGNALGSCYSHLPEEYKKQAWYDLHRLSQNKKASGRWGAGNALGSCYSHLPEENKKQAWDDLHRLVHDEDPFVREFAAHALGSGYSHLPEENKKQSWDDLHRLTQEKNDHVRFLAAHALGSCYSYLSEEYKKQAWDDLDRLTQDKDTDVWIAANYSLGRISIYRASQAKDDESVRKEFETALRFFEKASHKSTYYNAVRFFLPFYRSFYAITFMKENAEAEVKQYLAEAKSAVDGSKSKENLIEVVETLGNALKEAQSVRDLNDLKCNLNTYRLYCEHAEDIMNKTQGKAPGAVGLVMKGLPIFDKRIKQILVEIQQRANTAYKQSKGTPSEEIASIVNQEVQKWKIKDQEQMTRDVNYLIRILKTKLPGNQEIEDIRKEKYIERQYQLILMFIGMIERGDTFIVTGYRNIVGKNIVVNQQQLAKIPDEYAKSLQTFSDAVTAQFRKQNISQEKVAPVQESINELVKEVEGIKPEEKIDPEKKEGIEYNIKKVARGLLKILPEGAETLATFTPLAPFSKIIGKGVEEIVKGLQNEK